MTKKNAPCRQSGGSNGGIRDTLRKKDITPNRRAAQCFLCRFYAEICLQSGHVRRLCRLNGEKDPNAGMTGCVFERGVQGDFGGLTPLRMDGMVETPNTDRQSGSLVHAPHGENNGIFILNSNFQCPKRREYKLRHNVQEPARAGGLSVAGERYAVFCFKPQNTEVSKCIW